MNGRPAVIAHAVQAEEHRIGAHAAFTRRRREEEWTGNRTRQRAQLIEHSHHLGRERHEVLALHFHPLCRDTPQGFFPIEVLEFGPSRSTQFGRAGKRQDYEAQSNPSARIAIISFERAKEFWHLSEHHRPMAPGPTGRTECSSQGHGRIILDAAGRDGVAEHLTACLPQSSSGLDYSTLLNFFENRQQFRRINFPNEARSNLRKYIPLQPSENSTRNISVQLLALTLNPFPGDSLEGIHTRNLSRTFCRPFRHAGVDVACQKGPRLLPACACGCKSDGRIHPQSKGATPLACCLFSKVRSVRR